MRVMVSGPCSSGAADAKAREDNLRARNAAALAVLRVSHVPVVGVNLALPVIDAGGSETCDEIMLPLSLALSERCDAVLRIGGASQGADAEVARFIADGRPAFHCPSEIPQVLV